MAVTTQMVKDLRELTGAGILDCKKALEQSNGDMEVAAQLLKDKGLAAAAKKTERAATEGRIEAYVHPGNKLATLVEVACETDFVARTERFRSFCHDLAMQVAAANPRYLARQDVPQEAIDEQERQYRAELYGQDKAESIVERVIAGKLDKFYQEICLLEQPFIKDDSKTVQQLVTETIAILGENVVIRRFARFQIE